MKGLISLVAVCVSLVYVAMAPANAATDPKARSLVPTSGYALTGDGQTLVGAMTEYRNFDGQSNSVFASFVYDTKVDYHSGRRFFLNITSNRSNVSYPPISYTCVTGPEDPNKKGLYLGAEMYTTQNLLGANLQCYNQTHDAGYFVYVDNPQSCLTKTVSPSTDTRFSTGTHYTIDGPNCGAEVSIRSGNKVTEIKTGSGKSATPIIFNFPIHIEYDTM